MAANPQSPVMRKYAVARVDEIPEGGRLIVRVGDREIGIFHVDGQFYALRHRCPHHGGPLCTGDILGLVYSSGPGDIHLDASTKLLICPWHGWEFDIKTGRSYFDPQRTRARPYPVEVQPGDAVARKLESAELERLPGPYEAETIPVSVEDNYVVLAIREMRPPARPAGQDGG